MIKYLFTTATDGNIAYHVNDDKSNVDKNREALKSKYKVDVNRLIFMNQTHGSKVEIVTQNSKHCINDCDALVTNEKNLPLMVMVADCIPILMYDEKQKVIAAIHAGRNSTFLKIAQKTALIMMEKFNCKAENLKVNLGPSIQKCCYEVSNELEDIVKNSFGDKFTNNRLIDLQGINNKQLIQIGLKEENINISKICTKCSNEDYFSFRLNKHCGRFAGIITIE